MRIETDFPFQRGKETMAFYLYCGTEAQLKCSSLSSHTYVRTGMTRRHVRVSEGFDVHPVGLP